MYKAVKDRLVQILNECDGKTAVVFGKNLFYEENGETKTDYMSGWDEYYDDIQEDSDLKTEVENMQLFITLRN